MTKENRDIWNKIQKAKRLSDESASLLSDVLNSFGADELETNLQASNSNDLEETIQCYIQYDEDGEKIYDYLCKRK